MEKPWVAVKDVCHMYAVGYPSAKNKISAGTFPVPVYKIGKMWVIDRAVHEAYFTRMREVGLAAPEIHNEVRPVQSKRGREFSNVRGFFEVTC